MYINTKIMKLKYGFYKKDEVVLQEGGGGGKVPIDYVLYSYFVVLILILNPKISSYQIHAVT